MEQTAFTIRMDKDVKRDMDRVCDSLGITTSAAINMFARQLIREGGMPFKPTTKVDGGDSKMMRALERARIRAIANGTADMSLDEINAEIDSYRRERAAKKEEK